MDLVVKAIDFSWTEFDSISDCIADCIAFDRELIISNDAICNILRGIFVSDLKFIFPKTKVLTVNGDLNLRFRRINELPEGITIVGDLDLGCTKIAKLPEGLIVNGTLI